MGDRFTSEQIEELKKSPCVRDCSDSTLAFTEEFKLLFLDEYSNGMMPTEIFRKYGLDTSIIGQKRINNFSFRIRRLSKREDGVKDLRSVSRGRIETSGMSPEEKIEYLERRNEILKQENDFLKRVRSINRRRILSQSNLRRQKTNSN